MRGSKGSTGTLKKGELVTLPRGRMKRLLPLHTRRRTSALFHHAAEGVFTAALFADMNDLVSLGLSVAFGHELVLAAGTVMSGHDFGVRLRPCLRSWLHNGYPTVFALGAGHHDHVAGLNRFRVGDGLDGVHQFLRALSLLLCGYECGQRHQAGDGQCGAAVG
jgi:hypothetical protein